MTPAALADLVRSVAHDVLTDRGLDAAVLPAQVTVQRPSDPRHGDYATNVALLTAPRTDVPSRELAGWFADALAGADGIGEVEVAGPGFLNLRLADDTPSLVEVLAGIATCGSSRRGAGQVVDLVVEAAAPGSLAGARAEAHRTALEALLQVTGVALGPAGKRVVLAPGPVDLFRDRAPVPDACGASLSDALGADFARFALLRSPLPGALTVDLDTWSRRVVANPAFRVQYAHARAVAVVRGALDLGVIPAGADAGLLRDHRERALTAELADTGRVVDEAAARGEPHRLVGHLERVAGAFFTVHEGVDVLPRGDTPPDDVTQARVLLCDATRQVLAGAAGILGFNTPERL